MALLRCDFFSDMLEMGTSMTVVLPQASAAQIGVSTSSTTRETSSTTRETSSTTRETSSTTRETPVLYLLHGLSDDASAWLRYSSIERYATERGVAVVMPQVGRSFYADEAHGAAYWWFLSEELPHVVRSFFRVSDRREDTFVAGLSMGGYGAIKWALHQPGRFAAAASMSGALDLVSLTEEPERTALFHRVFHGSPGPQDDLFALLEQADPARVPPLYIGCGTEDPLHGHSVRFAAAATGAGLDVHTDFRPGGHEWALWDAVVRDVLAWLPLRR